MTMTVQWKSAVTTIAAAVLMVSTSTTSPQTPFSASSSSGIFAEALTAVGTKRPRTFSQQRQHQQQHQPAFTSSHLWYRKLDDTLTEASDISIFPSSSSSSSSSTATKTTIPTRPNPLTTTTAPPLPEWLGPRGHMLRANMEKLKSSMRLSFFSPDEIRELLMAIEDASLGDRNKMSGAAEFCTLLIETMEMGFNALVAAAYHYSSCVSARESRQRQSYSERFEDNLHGLHDLREYKNDVAKPQRRYGSHPRTISEDAWRLKRLEMVFSTVINHASSSRTRVTPNSRDAEHLRNLLLTESKDWRALAIRAGACLYRLRGLVKQQDGRLSREASKTAREALHVYAPLASRLGMHRLKNELENAAFRVLYRKQYTKVTALNEETRSADGPTIVESMQAVSDTVSQEIEELLSNDPVFANMTTAFSVSARIKEPYSLWRKMLRKSAKHTVDITDAIALRIVFDARKVTPNEDDSVTSARERALCYYVRQLCMSAWEPMDGRLKDYIKKPKANGYQSLHYTAKTQWNDQDWMMEVQIRSGAMHNTAEFGVASHWDYKASSAASASSVPSASSSTSPVWASASKPASDHPNSATSSSYLRSLQDWHWRHSYQHDASPVSFVAPLRLTVSEDGKVDEYNPMEEITMNTNTERAMRIKERTERLEPYIRAFAEAQSHMARDNVFVFLSSGVGSDGAILPLPSGASVSDALTEGRELLQQTATAVVRNGVEAAPSAKLQNGDVLYLL